jgi:multisubunit Na+/H+ antiporter MnhC subunit
LAKEIDQGLRKAGIHVSTPVLAVICLIFGILLLVFPQLVGYIIGIFLIIQGILLLVNYMESRPETPKPQKRTEPSPPPPPPPPPEEPTETPPSVPPTETA